MSSPLSFNKVCIIGVGLLGGSLGLEIIGKKISVEVIGVGRTRQNLAVALRRGLVTKIEPDLVKACSQADLVLLCGPVQTILAQLVTVAKHAPKNCLVMDVGSTKVKIMEQAGRSFKSGPYFVGAHPMAGTENFGAKSAQSDLFQNKLCFLTPLPGTPKRIQKIAEKFWKVLGARVQTISAKNHDDLLAHISHLPQLTAYGLVGAVTNNYQVSQLKKTVGGGFRSATRLAASPFEMWRDICLANSGPITKSLQSLIAELTQLNKMISKSDGKKLDAYFQVIAERRRRLEDSSEKPDHVSFCLPRAGGDPGFSKFSGSPPARGRQLRGVLK